MAELSSVPDPRSTERLITADSSSGEIEGGSRLGAHVPSCGMWLIFYFAPPHYCPRACSVRFEFSWEERNKKEKEKERKATKARFQGKKGKLKIKRARDLALCPARNAFLRFHFPLTVIVWES